MHRALKRFSPEFVCEERFIMSAAPSLPVTPVLTTLSFEERYQRALTDMRRGHPVVLVDDFDRENEGDLIVAAERITVSAMAMMIRECSGIVCLCLSDEMANRLDLPLMVSNNESHYGTAFTVSIEAREGVTTGVSALDRVTTIRAATAWNAQSEDLVRPGHVFPLRAAKGGVLERRGHTEGSVDLAILAGLHPSAVLCELTNPDGTMTKGEQLRRFAEQHHMVILSIEELAEQRQKAEQRA
jgi:3,4-dihydroxy 2-butanone 4-phosphate synthase